MMSTCKHPGLSSVDCCVRCYTYMCAKCTDASFKASLCEDCMENEEVSRDPDEWLENWVETVDEMERMRKASTDTTDFLLMMFHSAGFEAERVDGFAVSNGFVQEYDDASVLTLRVLEDDQTVVCDKRAANPTVERIKSPTKRPKRARGPRSSRANNYVPSSRTNTVTYAE